MRGSRIVVPESLRTEILNKIHGAHQGITKCRERARQSVWWPNISKDLEKLVKNCPQCIKHQSQQVEPLIPTQLPSLPWQRVAADIFHWKGDNYMLIVDYYSRFIEIAHLDHMTAEEVISRTKSIFARHGIPEELISDNGPQFSSHSFLKFSQEYGFDHITSSPLFPQSNGAAERAVKTIKTMWKKTSDPCLALLSYRATPLQNGYSPAELLMSRKLRTTVPIIEQERVPKVPEQAVVKEMESQVKGLQKINFDHRHRAVELPELNPGDKVWITDRKIEGNVVKRVAPRSYIINTTIGEYRRNRRFLTLLKRQTKDRTYSSQSLNISEESELWGTVVQQESEPEPLRVENPVTEAEDEEEAPGRDEIAESRNSETPESELDDQDIQERLGIQNEESGRSERDENTMHQNDDAQKIMMPQEEQETVENDTGERNDEVSNTPQQNDIAEHEDLVAPRWTTTRSGRISKPPDRY